MPDKPSNSGVRLVALAVLVGALSAVAGVSLWKVMQGPPAPADLSIALYPEPRVVDDFTLIDDQGAPFSLENLRGHWTLMFFGFTNCPDVCPSALYDLNLVSESIEAAGGEPPPDVRVVFVSVDPERDTPEKMSRYLSYFNPAFTGVTGDPAQLEPLAMQLGIAFRVEDHEPGAERYDVFHSASFLLINPEGRVHGVFGAPHDAEKISRDLLDLIGQSNF